MPDSIFAFFGLRENPFKISPDPRFLFVTDQAHAAADELVYAVRNRKGLILLTGEVGTGKTMLIRRLLDWLAEERMPTALIFNSRIRPEHLLDFILHDFGVTCDSPVKSDKLMALNRWLLERYRGGQTPVLVVDEAQGLEPETLEEIRLLLNFETPRDKLVQIVLAGQPELDTKLKRHELRQLRQRITIRSRTAPLTPEQTSDYIRHRLRVAGAANDHIFEPDAAAAVYAHTHGIPRVINVLCEHAMVNACADGSQTVSRRAVDQAATECQLDRAESVARILQTGSYSAAELADEIRSILGAVSSRLPNAQARYQSQAPAGNATVATTAGSAAPPLMHFSPFERTFPNAQHDLANDAANSILSPFGSAQATEKPAETPVLNRVLLDATAVAPPARPAPQTPEIETIPLPSKDPLAVAAVPVFVEAEPQDVEIRVSGTAADPIAHQEIAHQANGEGAAAVEPPVAAGVSTAQRGAQSAKPLPAREQVVDRASPAASRQTVRRPETFSELLSLWSASFARDARASYRGAQRHLQSFRLRYWNPTMRGVRREARYLETRIVRFVSDPRWKQNWNNLTAACQRQWGAAKSAALPHLERILGAEQETTGTGSRSTSSRTMRGRAATSLRRWLREPIASQRKTPRSRHRTA